MYIAIYWLNPFRSGNFCSTIRLTYQPINHFYSILGNPKPCDSKLCVNILKNVKHTVQTKSPISVKDLYKLHGHFSGKFMSLANLCKMLIWIFSTKGLLCFSEFINMRRTNVILETPTLLFSLKKVRHVYGEGCWVYLTNVSSVLSSSFVYSILWACWH